MKMINPNFIVIAIVGLLCGSAIAAGAGKTDSIKPRTSASPPANAIVEKTFENIEFIAMPIREVVEYLRETMESTGVNFIVSDEVAAVEIDLKLRNVSFDQLNTSIEIASEGRVKIESVDGRLYHIRPGEVRVTRPEPILRVFNLSRILAGRKEAEISQTIEDLHQTVGLAFEMLVEAQRAAGGTGPKKTRIPINSKFHPGTKLMIVIGAPDDVEVFQEVTSQLLGEPRHTVRNSGNPFGAMGMGGAGGMGMGAGAADAMGGAPGTGGLLSEGGSPNRNPSSGRPSGSVGRTPPSSFPGGGSGDSFAPPKKPR